MALQPGIPVTGRTVVEAAVEATKRAAQARAAAAAAAKKIAQERKAAAPAATPTPPWV